MPNTRSLFGDKKRGSHSSLTPKAQDLVKEAVKIQEVTGIQPGPIDRTVRSKVPRLKYKTKRAGLEVSILSAASKQIVFLYTGYPEEVKNKLEEWG